ncbi:MAG: formate--tetrahydrofolate ligase [Saprospiraceae bacterium]
MRQTLIKPIQTIAAKLNDPDNLEMYRKYKAKLPLTLIDENKIASSNLILTTALNPTMAGEGKGHDEHWVVRRVE